MSKLSNKFRKQLRKDVYRNTNTKAYERLMSVIDRIDNDEEGYLEEFLQQHFDEEFMDKLQGRVDKFAERLNEDGKLKVYSSDITDTCYKNFLLSPLFIREFGKFLQAKEKEAKSLPVLTQE